MGLQPYGKYPRPAATLRPATIARKLKMSPEAVRDRIAKMTAEGVLAGYEIFPNFRLLGLEAVCYYVKLKDAAQAEALAKKLEVVDGIVGVYTFTEPELNIILAYHTPADLERKLRLLLAMAGEAELVRFFTAELPPPLRPLSNLDWRIIKALRGDALRPLSQVARELHIHPRTVKRRFERMSEEGAVFVIPIVETDKVPGLILFEMLVWLEPDAGVKTFQAVTRALDAHMVCIDYPADPELGNFGVGLYATRLGDIEKCAKLAKGVRGVAKVRPLIVQRSEERFGWMDDAIEVGILADLMKVGTDIIGGNVV